MEKWKKIKGYENYLVSNQGRVFHPKSDRFVKLRKNTKDGYLYVDLYKNDDVKIFAVDRLVALAFIDNPENKPTVNHINADKTNNFVENLEWNFRHSFDNGLCGNKGSKHGLSKLVEPQVLEIRRLYSTGDYYQKDLGRMFDVSSTLIGLIVKRRIWSHNVNRRIWSHI